MKTLKCKCGRDILVDDEDFDRVREFNWNCHGGRRVKVTYRRVVLSLPHFVMRTIEQLDHCNRNDHDNQKSNLRLATTEQNNANRGVGKNNTSGFKGVCFVGPRCNASKPWRAG